MGISIKTNSCALDSGQWIHVNMQVLVSVLMTLMIVRCKSNKLCSELFENESTAKCPSAVCDFILFYIRDSNISFNFNLFIINS